MTPLTLDRDYIIHCCQELVQIDSTNPTLSPTGAGETAVAHTLTDYLNQLGLQTTATEIAPDRWNVVGRLPGHGNGRSLLLNAHMDTVGVAGMENPFSGEIRDGKLYGRGSYDMKASLAAMLGVAKALTEANVKLAGDLLITAVADEEALSQGMEALLKTVTADAAIVTEPTDLAICRAHRGFIWYEVKTIGRAAHGSRFREGIDANMRMGRFLAELDQLEQALRQRPPHELAGPPSLHASKLRGGTEISVYAAQSLLQMERRTIPGETVAQATAELEEIAMRLETADPTFKANITPTFSREPFAVPKEAPIVAAVEAACEAVLGAAPTHIGQTFWTDAALLAEAGIETVIIGPTGAGLHSAVEWVDVQSVLDLTHVLLQTAVSFCGTAD